jgi:hypothetical protein
MTTTNNAASNTYTLSEPLKRGNQTITEVTLRRPVAGDLRGTKLTDTVNLDIDSMAKVFPRITTPMLTEADVYRLDPADLLQLGGIFNLFFMPKETEATTDSPTA